MFEITAQDIGELDDKKLRSLVGLLCEAELRVRGYSTAAATWGGHQNAMDGGLDVRVDLPADCPIDGFIPRPLTGFQVKRQNVTPAKVADEMCPAGALRPAIAALAHSGGAYIIVSSQGSTAAGALKNRRNAMTKAVGQYAAGLALDFYDSSRMASWVRRHAGLVMWVRAAIGKAVTGWESFGAWSNPIGGLDEEYLLEDGVRIRPRPATSQADLSAEQGIAAIRTILRKPATVVRLIGLSGVGKTRFAQALFDSRVGDDPLDPTLAVYTNMNNEPDPQPVGLASDLAANGTPAIVVVDNCAADLHERLAKLVMKPGSPLSALTIEYDIRDDQPEGTEAFEVLVASTGLIEKLLRKRFPKLSEVDARSAAEFSGGNARIAVALAETVSRGGTLSKLSDSQLFERLFEQRQGQDRSLLRAAQALATVYSFDGENLDEGSELNRLARLIGVSVDDLYRDTAELIRRDLAQRRGKWRAVLPHALANRLAATALQDISAERIHECLVAGAPERLAISLARRIGYLDGSKEAFAIVGEWFKAAGWLGAHVWNLNSFGRAIFNNCLPANPEAGLRALEAARPAQTSGAPIDVDEYVLRALRSMAWEPSLFERCCALLQFVAVRGNEQIAKRAAAMHGGLFFVLLSGTHATIDQRVAIVRGLVASSEDKEQILGITALGAMLKARHFSADQDFRFGARSRDYGYQPKTSDEWLQWYRRAFALAEQTAQGVGKVAISARSTIAENFRGLWAKKALRDTVTTACLEIAGKGFWPEGWIAARRARHFDEKDRQSQNYTELSNLIEKLRPIGLVDRVRGYVFAGDPFGLDDVEAEGVSGVRASIERKNKEVYELGQEVATDESALSELLSRIVQDGANRFYFGMGLAATTDDPRELWQRLTQQLETAPQAARSVEVFRGMLFELVKSDSDLAGELLDSAVKNEPLAEFFPLLQAAVVVDRRGISRLITSAKLGRAPAQHFGRLFIGRAIEVLPPRQIAKYILILSRMPSGQPVARSVLNFQFYEERQANRPHARELIEAGRELLRRTEFERTNSSEDHHLLEIIKICMRGDDAHDVAVAFCNGLKRAIEKGTTYAFYHGRMLQALLARQPSAVLDTFLTGDSQTIEEGVRLLGYSDQLRAGPLDVVDEEALVAWCMKDPVVRFPAIASVVSVFEESKDDKKVAWRPIACELVHRAPDPIAVMREVIKRFRPMMWEGSRAAIVASNVALLDQFDSRGNVEVDAYISASKERLLKQLQVDLVHETRDDKERDERFE